MIIQGIRVFGSKPSGTYLPTSNTGEPLKSSPDSAKPLINAIHISNYVAYK